MTVIPKGSTNPKAAYFFLKYMLSEDGNLLMYYGHEGEHYNFVDKQNDQGENRKMDPAHRVCSGAVDNNYTQFMGRNGYDDIYLCISEAVS